MPEMKTMFSRATPTFGSVRWTWLMMEKSPQPGHQRGSTPDSKSFLVYAGTAAALVFVVLMISGLPLLAASAEALLGLGDVLRHLDRLAVDAVVLDRVHPGEPGAQIGRELSAVD